MNLNKNKKEHDFRFIFKMVDPLKGTSIKNEHYYFVFSPLLWDIFKPEKPIIYLFLYDFHCIFTRNKLFLFLCYN